MEVEICPFGPFPITLASWLLQQLVQPYKLRFWNAKATNKSELSDFAIFDPKNWLPWQRPLSHRQKWAKSAIYGQTPTIL